MRIFITSGIFEPDGGGPATYAARLGEKLARAGHTVMVITMSEKRWYGRDAQYPFRLVRLRRTNKLLNRVKFLLYALWFVPRCDIVYTLDWFAVGLPISFASRIFGKPYVVRVGGDYGWEKYLARGGTPMTLRDFYAKHVYTQKVYQPFSRLILAVLMRATHVVFNSREQRGLYRNAYELEDHKTSVIYNPVPRNELADVHRTTASTEFVYWGRLVVSKNLDGLLRAFARAKIPISYTLAIMGNGPQESALERLARELGVADRVAFTSGMYQREALERVKNARAFVLPSWTDISPNQVYEALAIGLPALVTSENYLSIRDQLPIMTDPRSVNDIAAKLEILADDRSYRDFSQKFKNIRFDNSWDAVAKQHEELFKQILRK